MTTDEYFAADGVSNSMLKHFERSPAHLVDYLAQPQEATKAQEIGTFFHDLLLLENAPQNIALRPLGMDFRKAEGKAWKKEQEAAGKTILTQDEYDSIYGMRDSIMRITDVKHAIERGQREYPLFAPFSHGAPTVMRKCRIDLVPLGKALVDFKSTTDARKSHFERDIYNLQYYRQASYYLDIANVCGLDHSEFVFVAVEKTRPFASSVFVLDAEAIEFGRRKYSELLVRYMHCRDTNDWPAYPITPQTISLPHWAMREEAA